MIQLPIKQRILNGITLLDNRGPKGWRERINLDTLSMGVTTHCIIGQIFANGEKYNNPHFQQTCEELGLFTKPAIVDHGFDCGGYSEFKQLKNEWIAALTEESTDVQS